MFTFDKHWVSHCSWIILTSQRFWVLLFAKILCLRKRVWIRWLFITVYVYKHFSGTHLIWKVKEVLHLYSWLFTWTSTKVIPQGISWSLTSPWLLHKVPRFSRLWKSEREWKEGAYLISWSNLLRSSKLSCKKACIIFLSSYP